MPSLFKMEVKRIAPFRLLRSFHSVKDWLLVHLLAQLSYQHRIKIISNALEFFMEVRSQQSRPGRLPYKKALNLETTRPRRFGS